MSLVVKIKVFVEWCNQGFILIEMMIVVVLMGIFVVIVYFLYQDLVCKIWCVDVKVVFVEFVQFMECIYIENNSFKLGGNNLILFYLESLIDGSQKYYDLLIFVLISISFIL